MLHENFIAMVAADRGAEARGILQDNLSAIVLDHLEERKRELAAGLFSGTPNEQVTEDAEELEEGTYEMPDGSEVRNGVEADRAWKIHHQQNPKSKKSQFHTSTRVATPKKKVTEEGVEQIDEISGSTALSVAKKRLTQAQKAQRSDSKTAYGRKLQNLDADDKYGKAKKAYEYAFNKNFQKGLAAGK